MEKATRPDGIKTVKVASRQAWRDWLAENHLSESAVWLIIYKKASGKPTVTYKEAVEEALCFGWIDSKPNKRDAESYFQYFSQRKPKSNWSKINKEMVAWLEASGKMFPQGAKMVALAKRTGTWDALNKVDKLVIPDDLEEEFARFAGAKANFEAFPPSVRRGILEWILNAKRAPTRQKRIRETAEKAARNERAAQWGRRP